MAPQESTALKDVTPAANKAPRLFGLGNAAVRVDFHAFVTTDPLLTTEDPILAILLLAAYYVFLIDMNSKNKQAICLLGACCVNVQAIWKFIGKNGKFKDLLRSLGFHDF